MKQSRKHLVHKTPEELDQLADLLKERIYASLALLAVLMSLDAAHVSTARAAAVVGGTALSLWAASLVSTQMAHRMVRGGFDRTGAQLRLQLRRHSPLLASAVLPLLLIGLAKLDAFSLTVAINVSIWSIIISLVGWSLASARAMGASGFATLALGAIEAGIGLAIVGLKIAIGH